jgi:hypothetical protein
MKEAGLRGVSRRKGPYTTVRGTRNHSTPDLVDRDFAAESPNELWVPDITYVLTDAESFISQLCSTMQATLLKWSAAYEVPGGKTETNSDTVPDVVGSVQEQTPGELTTPVGRLGVGGGTRATAS